MALSSLERAEIASGICRSLKGNKRSLNPRQRLFFPNHFKQVIQARAGGVAGAGEADGMDEHAGFYAEFGV